jgi:hypothetical protein
MQLSASCLDNVVRNASNATGVFEPSPVFKAGCNRTRVSEEFSLELDILNFQNSSDTVCKPFPPQPGKPGTVVEVFADALREVFAAFDPCNPVLEIPSVTCEKLTFGPAIGIVAIVKVTSPFPCTGRRFVSDWIGSPITKKFPGQCQSSTCVCQGLGAELCNKVLAWLNSPVNGVIPRSYAPVGSSFTVVQSNAACLGDECSGFGVPLSYCTP